jgi:hypothetical protein
VLKGRKHRHLRDVPDSDDTIPDRLAGRFHAGSSCAAAGASVSA